MQITRRQNLGALLAMAGAAALPVSTAVAADECSMLRGQTLTFIVTFPPGGGFDAYARLLEPYLEKVSGAEVAVKNIDSAIVGVKAVRDASPDGRTIAILHAAEVMLTRLLEGDTQPDLFTDFTLLGQITETPVVWVASADSGIKTMDDLVGISATRPPLAGTRNVTGVEFAGIAAVSSLGNLSLEVVPVYRGSAEVVLAMARGEVDLAAYSFESLRPAIEAGELRPLLQLSSSPIADSPLLAGVPVAGGPDGWLAQRAKALGADVDETLRLADAAILVSRQPRVIVAPKGLEPETARCLQQLFLAATSDPEFVATAAAAKRSLDIIAGEEFTAKMQGMEPSFEALLPVIKAAQLKARA